ncbi:MAG: hypothetical protein ABIL76_03850 [candidate division WOR-3 bacterium]
MNQNLYKIIELYATTGFEELVRFLNGLSKPALISTLIDFVTIYINDKNSSKLREILTLKIAGYEPLEEKLGYNGYKLEIGQKGKIFCEVKPQNTITHKRKLDGGGSFNDYTKERFEKDSKQNLMILSSGFVGGKLIYVFEFPFECIKERLRMQLEKRFPSARKKGEYLRSASFSFKHYKDCKDLKVVFCTEKINEFKKFLTRDIYNFLKERR